MVSRHGPSLSFDIPPRDSQHVHQPHRFNSRFYDGNVDICAAVRNDYRHVSILKNLTISALIVRCAFVDCTFVDIDKWLAMLVR